jgi:lycopene beta-cyclase
MVERRYDVVLAGGGLAASLIAWRLALRRPELSVAVVERAGRLGGDHTWSFFDSDLTRTQRGWIDPIVIASWDGYDVRFPERVRTLSTRYNSAVSDRLHETVAPLLGDRLIAGDVAEVAPDRVTLADGRVIEGAVIDARGAKASGRLDLGWQKFLGLEIRTEAAHGLTRPFVMDASVEQMDGYRFVYVLPFAPDRMLVEDTYYADGRALDRGALRERVLAYAAAKGWRGEVVREEEGVLPIALDGDIEAFFADGPPVARAGLGAAMFHPTTGYSLPDAAATADLVAGLSDLSGSGLFRALTAHAIATWKARGFYRLLNRMLFRAAEPGERWRVMQRFYGLNAPLIQRFYGGRTTTADKVRILTGKPPVPVGRALKQLSERGSRLAEAA